MASVGTPGVITTDYIAVNYVIPATFENLALSDKEIEEFRQLAGQLLHSVLLLFNAAFVEPRLFKLLARIVSTTADMFEEERKELENV